ncbi:hypothetical protein ANCCAN_01598 [Ancylostoma caninum]|uniref:SCP domain-containing protein n=1 Tax=Ancylostoma caninum TaxID=29170 RepID=A0A368H8X4_ANCCA|nr:hypothetical protein ANCCAN_01598 [Ancylostoma caninum]
MFQRTGSQNLYLPKFNIPNFGKMMWDSNSYIGCAVVRCSSFTNVVCHYGPKTRSIGRWGNTIYHMGPTCNRCKNSCVEGLCS